MDSRTIYHVLRSVCVLGILFGVLVPHPVSADAVAEPPATLADRVASIPLQKLAELDAAARGRIDETRVTLNEMLVSAAPDLKELAEVYGRLGGLYAAYRLSAAAERAFRNARQLDPSSFHWAYYSAHLALEFGETEAALALLEEAQALDSTYPTLALRRGEALLGLNRLDEAQGEYRAASIIDEQRAAALYGLAQVDLLRRDWSSAAEKFTEVLTLQPQADAVNYGLGQALVRLGRREEAREYLAKRGVVKPTYADPLVAELKSLQRGARYHFEQAMGAVNRGDHAAAVREFAAGLAEQPGNARARTSYARALWIAGDQDGALRELRQAATDGPEETLPRFLMAVARDAAGDAAGAERLYQEILALDATHQGALTYLGSLKLRQGDHAAGADYLGQAIEAGANLLPVYLQYWGALRANNTPSKTLRQQAEWFDQRFPEPPMFRYLQARLLIENGSAQQAVKLAGDLVERMPVPQHVEVYALSLAAAGKWSEAVDVLSNLVEMAQQMGAFDQTQRLQQLLALYRDQRLPDPTWPPDDPIFNAPPVDPGTPMKNYPAPHPY